MDLDDFQKKALATDETKRGTISLYGLAGEVGSIFSTFKKRLRDRPKHEVFREDLIEELGDVLWYLASIASQYQISLNDVAEKNISKANALFDSGSPQNFDQKYPAHEHFPRHLKIRFMLDPKTGHSQMFIEAEKLGDPLSDNVEEDDFYRFHDIFHFRFLTFLGWSPVLRKLLKLKRKSNKKTDETQDGARAAITEETISAYVFAVAEDHDFFPEIRSIPTNMLKTVARLASKYEVSVCTLKQWQQAIWHACRIYRDLVDNGGGIVELDLDERKVEFLGPAAAKT